jgi:hypothetical protein
MLNRSSDWLHQAPFDLDQAKFSAEADHHEGPGFACPPGVERGLNPLFLSLDSGSGVKDGADPCALCPAQPPRSLARPRGIWRIGKATTLPTMPRSLTPSVRRWPEPEQLMRQVEVWAKQQGEQVPSLERVAVFGSDGRGSAGVGSDLERLLIDAASSGPPRRLLLSGPLEPLPLSGALVGSFVRTPVADARDVALTAPSSGGPARRRWNAAAPRTRR